MHPDCDYKKSLDYPVFRLENQKLLARLVNGYKKYSECTVLRSEYHKFSARASRSHYMICEITVAREKDIAYMYILLF